jgi:hypothetical protein
LDISIDLRRDSAEPSEEVQEPTDEQSENATKDTRQRFDMLGKLLRKAPHALKKVLAKPVKSAPGSSKLVEVLEAWGSTRRTSNGRKKI